MFSRQIPRAVRLCSRCYATDTATTPPLLLKIRADMKTAMRARDTNRLSVLKSLLTASLNASKTSSPINTDMQVLSLIRKTSATSKAASLEFKNAGGQDLADKEDSQVSVLEEYVGDVQMLGEQEIRTAVEEVVKSMKEEGAPKMGDVLKKVFGEDVLGGKNVERSDVARIVKEVMAGKS